MQQPGEFVSYMRDGAHMWLSGRVCTRRVITFAPSMNQSNQSFCYPYRCHRSLGIVLSTLYNLLEVPSAFGSRMMKLDWP